MRAFEIESGDADSLSRSLASFVTQFASHSVTFFSEEQNQARGKIKGFNYATESGRLRTRCHDETRKASEGKKCMCCVAPEDARFWAILAKAIPTEATRATQENTTKGGNTMATRNRLMRAALVR